MIRKGLLSYVTSLLLASFLVLIFIGQSFGAIIRVKQDSPNNGPGSDWDHAYHTVTASLAAAVSGDEVWVAKGTYVERITLKSGVALYGGFAGTETSREQRNWSANATILDGNRAGTVVTCPSGAVSTTRIDGFSIRNGKGYHGGGVFCTGSLTIANNRITSNVGSYGGGIYSDISSTTICNNSITANSADYEGGGIYAFSGGLVLTNNTIAGNTSEYSGGIRAGAPITLYNNIVAFNSSGLNFGGAGTATLRNNCFYNNGSYDYYGVAPGEGDIQADPQFTSASFGDFHIRPGSPCVDAGYDGATQPDWFDIDGEARKRGVHVDIGADESDGVDRTFAPNIIRVSITGDDAHDGSSWALAKRTVQAGISAAATNGGEVWVAAGTYVEQVSLPYAVFLYGGFAGTEAMRDERNWSSNATIMDGGGLGTVVTVSSAGWCGAGIDGFTLRNGKATTGSALYAENSFVAISNNAVVGNTNTGGGAVISCTTGRQSLTNNTITGNAGGGIRLYNTNATVSNNNISGNKGVGIFCSSVFNGKIVISGNVISENTAGSGYGGGIYARNDSTDPCALTLLNNVITRNTGASGGGLYLLTWHSVTMSGNVVACNSATTYYGGGLFSADCGLTMSNNTFAENFASIGGGGMYLSRSPATMSNNIVALNSSGLFLSDSTATLRNNDVYNLNGNNYYGLTAGVGDISADPEFVSPSAWDYRIQPDSPCVDAGWNGAPSLPDVDMDGQPRVQPSGGTIDIGADESDGIARTAPAPLALHVDGANGDDANDGSAWALAKKTVQGGIDAASELGAEVWVKEGIYSERIALKPHVSLFGGFDGTETTKNARNWAANVTILDGNAGGSVVTVSGVNSGAIDGFTIRNGKSAGIYCNCAPISICNNFILDNAGNGIKLSYSAATVSNNVIRSNTLPTPSAVSGIYCVSSPSHICNNAIVANGDSSGCGVQLLSSAATLCNNIIAYNPSGISVGGGNPVIRNNDVYNPGGANYSGISAGAGDISLDPGFVGVAYGVSTSGQTLRAEMQDGMTRRVSPQWTWTAGRVYFLLGEPWISGRTSGMELRHRLFRRLYGSMARTETMVTTAPVGRWPGKRFSQR